MSNDTQAKTLADFLLERIAEDESMARAAAHQKIAGPFHGNWNADSALLRANGALDHLDRAHIARHDPARVLAECAAKRAIVALADEATGLDAQVDSDFRVRPRDEDLEPYVGDLILRHLAAVYADHPDYDPAWAVS